MNSGDERAIQSGYGIGVVPYRTRFWQPRRTTSRLCLRYQKVAPAINKL